MSIPLLNCRTVDDCKVRLQIWDTAGQGKKLKQRFCNQRKYERIVMKKVLRV
jgi:hypothetical protein